MAKAPRCPSGRSGSRLNMLGYLYIIQSVKNKMFYVGSTIDVKNRLEKHNNGEVKATKNRGPWVIKFTKKYNIIREARQIEYKLKKMKSRKVVEQIIKDQNIKITI